MCGCSRCMRRQRLSSSNRNSIDVTYSSSCSHLTYSSLFDFDGSRQRVHWRDMKLSLFKPCESWTRSAGHVWWLSLCTSTAAVRTIRTPNSPRKLEILCSADASAPEEYDRPSLAARLPVVLQESFHRAGGLFLLIVHCAEVECRGASLGPKPISLWRWIMGLRPARSTHAG